jgi:uncharacterized protein (UPF0218 family)
MYVYGKRLNTGPKASTRAHRARVRGEDDMIVLAVVGR